MFLCHVICSRLTPETRCNLCLSFRLPRWPWRTCLAAASSLSLSVLNFNPSPSDAVASSPWRASTSYHSSATSMCRWTLNQYVMSYWCHCSCCSHWIGFVSGEWHLICGLWKHGEFTSSSTRTQQVNIHPRFEWSWKPECSGPLAQLHLPHWWEL